MKIDAALHQRLAGPVRSGSALARYLCRPVPGAVIRALTNVMTTATGVAIVASLPQFYLIENGKENDDV